MSNTYALANSKKSSEKQLEMAKRRAILMRIAESQKDDNWTFEELAEKMRQNHWVVARWPSYSHTTAHRDFTASMELVRDDLKALAMPYFIRQIDHLDEAIDTLAEFMRDDTLTPKTRIDSANAMRGFLVESIKVFGNFAPKEMHIKKATVEYNLDNFMKYRKQAAQELAAEIIDGEVVDSD